MSVKRWLAMYSRWVEALGVGALCLVHLALGQGLFPALSPEASRLGPSLLGCVGLVSVFAIGARAFGRVAGSVGALLYALALPVLLHEAAPGPDLLLTVLDVTAVAVLVVGRPQERVGSAVAAGALLGLSLAVRPTALPLCLLASAWLLVRARRSGTWRQRLGPAVGLLTASALFAWAPVPGLQSPAPWSAGALAHRSNRPEGLGPGTQPPQLLKLLEQQRFPERTPDAELALYQRFARADAGEALSPTEVELYWWRKAVAFALHEPEAYARLLGRKLLFLLIGPEEYERAEVRRAAESAKGWPLPTAPVLGLLGTLGLLVAVVRRRVEPWTLLAFASLGAVGLLFAVVSGVRLTLVPLWCVWAGLLVSSVGAALREERARVALGVATLAVALLSWAGEPLRRGEANLARLALLDETGAEYARHLSAGRLDLAAQLFLHLQAAGPGRALLYGVRGVPFELPELAEQSGRLSEERFGTRTETDTFHRARLALRAGQCEAALPTLERLGEGDLRLVLFDHLEDPNLLAAGCLLSEGRREEARLAVLFSLAQHPGTAEGLAAAIAASEALEGPEEEREPWEEELWALHDAVSAHHALARARVDWAQYTRALTSADAVLRALPESGVAHYARARALAGLERDEEALESYGRALVLFPRHAFETQPFDQLLREALERQPERPEWLSLAAEHALRRGDLRRARLLAERATARFGASVPPYHLERQAWLARAVSPGMRLEPEPTRALRGLLGP